MIENPGITFTIMLFIISIYYRIVNVIQCDHYFKKFIYLFMILKFAFENEFNNMK